MRRNNSLHRWTRSASRTASATASREAGSNRRQKSSGATGRSAPAAPRSRRRLAPRRPPSAGTARWRPSRSPRPPPRARARACRRARDRPGGSRSTALLISALPLASGCRPQIVAASSRAGPQRDDVGVDPAEAGPRSASRSGSGRRNAPARAPVDAVARKPRIGADFARVARRHAARAPRRRGS